MNFFVCFILLSYSAIGSGYVSTINDKPVTTDEIKELRKDLFVTRGYDKNARPIPPRDQLRVQLTLNLISINKLDIETQRVNLNGWLTQTWHDDSLAWNTKSQWKHIELLRVPPEEVYKPDIMVYNNGDFSNYNMVQTKALVYANGMVMWVPPLTVNAMCKLDLKKWPFDEHICFIKFGSWTHDGLIMDVKASNKTDNMDDYVRSQEFDVEFLNVTNKNKFYPCCKEPYPSVTYYFKIQRKPTLYHHIISVPALVAIISSLATFWFPIRSKIRFVLNGISLLTLTLLLIHLSTELGFSSVSVPIAVRFLSLTTLFIGIIQIWFTIGYNISLMSCQIPLWTIKITKPLVQMYKNSENEVIHLTTEQSPDVSKKGSPNAEDLTFILDKVVFILFALALAINSYF